MIVVKSFQELIHCLKCCRHEFEMTIQGTIWYLLSALFLTFSKLASQIMMTVPLYVAVLSLDYGDNVTSLMIFLGNYFPYFYHNIKEHIINYWLTANRNCGYELQLKFIPNSSSHGIFSLKWSRPRPEG